MIIERLNEDFLMWLKIKCGEEYMVRIWNGGRDSFEVRVKRECKIEKKNVKLLWYTHYNCKIIYDCIIISVNCIS